MSIEVKPLVAISDVVSFSWPLQFLVQLVDGSFIQPVICIQAYACPGLAFLSLGTGTLQASWSGESSRGLAAIPREAHTQLQEGGASRDPPCH